MELLDNQAILCHIFPQKIDKTKEENMGYKKVDKTVSFAELSLFSSAPIFALTIWESFRSLPAAKDKQ